MVCFYGGESMAEAKKKVRAKDLIEDLRSGLTDSEIQEKHGLTKQQMQNVFSRLLQMGALTQFDLEQRTPKPVAKEEALTKCKACGKSYSDDLAQCPECGLSKDAVISPRTSRVPSRSIPPPRPAKAVLLIVGVVVLLVAALGGLGAYFWLKTRQPQAVATEPARKHFLSVQDLAQAYADQNELSGLTALGTFDEVKTATGKPDFQVDAPDIDGRTLLMVAVEYSRFDVAQYLLYHGANMYAVDLEGNTPAILATKKGLADILALLVRKGYDVDFKNRHGESVRSLAHGTPDSKLREIVIEGTKLPETDRIAIYKMEWERMTETRSKFCARFCANNISPRICAESCKKYYGVQR